MLLTMNNNFVHLEKKSNCKKIIINKPKEFFARFVLYITKSYTIKYIFIIYYI